MDNYKEYMNNSALIVDRAALRDNVAAIRSTLSPGTEIIPVLKADAYGLGMARTAEVLSPLPGVRGFAVAHTAEGVRLREAGERKEILLLGNPAVHALGAAAEADLTLTLGRRGLAELLCRESERLGKSVSVQLKLDTGLHRTGAAPGEELAALLRELAAAGERLTLRGVYSHFADTDDAPRCRGQYELFLRGLEQVEKAGFAIPLRHICDSAASELYPEYHMDAVRLGRRLMLDHPTRPLGNIREAASWRTVVTDVRSRRAGDSLGYADAYILPRDGKIAIIGVGYGDGLPPTLARAHGEVLIRGHRCKLLACCMDQSFVDVTGLDEPLIGEEVTLLGYDSLGNLLSGQEVTAVYGGCEGCEITSALPDRVARVYIN